MKRNSAKVMLDGEPTTWIGVNFWSRGGGPLMWQNYDAALVTEELTVMRDHGMTTTRSFLYWPHIQPTPETLDEQVLANVQEFLDQHERLGMTTIPTFIVGHMSGENWDPAWRQGRDIFGDVWFVARTAWYIREVTARFAKHPAIAGWLLSNEIPIYGDWKGRGIESLRPEVITSWTQLLVDAVRAGGGTQPVSTGDGHWGVEVTGNENGFRVREVAPQVDFLGPHVYRMETDLVRQHLGAAFICELLDFGKPVVMEEFGLTSDYVSEENAAHYYRQLLHNTLLAGATGWLCWNNTDYDNLYGQPPYSHHPFEMHFGVTDVDGRPKPQAKEMRAFADVARRIDFARLSRPDSKIALVVSSYLENQYEFTYPDDAAAVFDNTRQAYVAAREADLPVAVIREADGLADKQARPGVGLPIDGKLYLLPSFKQLTAPTWRQLLELAEAGATVYCSYFMGTHPIQRGPWWPRLDETFGVTKQLTYGLTNAIEDDELRVRFVTEFGDIEAGEELVFAVGGTVNSRSYLPVVPTSADEGGAEVIAVDAHERPVLLRKRAGQGWLVLSTYPLEHMAAVTPRVNPEPTARLYAALAAEAGVTPEVRVDDPRVLVATMVHDDGRQFAWFVSESAETLQVNPILSGALSHAKLTSLNGTPQSSFALAPYAVAVIEILP